MKLLAHNLFFASHFGRAAGAALAATLMLGSEPAAAQGRGASAPGTNMSILNELGSVPRLRAGDPGYSGSMMGGRFGQPDFGTRSPERPMPHMPQAPISDWTR